jgi:hypothetical protein
MKKNAISFFLYLLIILPFITGGWIASSSFDKYIISSQGIWIILIVVGSIWFNETLEGKSKGYALLSVLPIKNKEIVKSKFAVVFFIVGFLVAYNFIIHNIVSASSRLIELARIVILTCGDVALIAGGLMYILVFRFGSAKAVKIAMITFFSIIASTILFNELVLVKMDFKNSDIADILLGLSWLYWIFFTFLCMSIYYVFMQIALRAKEAQKG